MGNVDNSVTLDKSRWSLGPVEEGLLCAILRIVAVKSQKRAVDFVRIRSVFDQNAPQFNFLQVSYLWDIHRQLLWWNIVVGNFSSNKQKLLTIAPLLTSCWWHNKHVSPVVTKTAAGGDVSSSSMLSRFLDNGQKLLCLDEEAFWDEEISVWSKCTLNWRQIGNTFDCHRIVSVVGRMWLCHIHWPSAIVCH